MVLTWRYLLHLLSCAGFFVSLVEANPTGTYPRTNAERFQQGLGPLKPRKFYNPDATRPAPPRRSAAGSVTGPIGMYLHPADPTPSCYMQPNPQSCGPLSTALIFTTFLSTGPEDITAPSQGRYLGLSSTQGNVVFAPTNEKQVFSIAALAPATVISSTGAGTPESSTVLTETTIFTVGAVGANNAALITANFVNDAGATPATSGTLTWVIQPVGNIFAFANPSPYGTIVYPAFIPT